MDRHEVIARLCALATKVGSEVFKDRFAHDCFCGEVNPIRFQFEVEVIEWIEDAVERKKAAR